MSEELTLVTLVSSLASTGLLASIYGRLRRYDNLCQLHANRHPEDSPLVK